MAGLLALTAPNIRHIAFIGSRLEREVGLPAEVLDLNYPRLESLFLQSHVPNWGHSIYRSPVLRKLYLEGLLFPHSLRISYARFLFWRSLR